MPEPDNLAHSGPHHIFGEVKWGLLGRLRVLDLRYFRSDLRESEDEDDWGHLKRSANEKAPPQKSKPVSSKCHLTSNYLM